MSDQEAKQVDLWGNMEEKGSAASKRGGRKSKADKQAELMPEKLGKAVRLPVPDFSDPWGKLKKTDTNVNNPN
ncbi:hypothetical protein RW64_18540 [Geobacter sulfurreducens]|nr:hypothetical protein RW64_18540 [Geobacter sulfurreducens]